MVFIFSGELEESNFFFNLIIVIKRITKQIKLKANKMLVIIESAIFLTVLDVEA